MTTEPTPAPGRRRWPWLLAVPVALAAALGLAWATGLFRARPPASPEAVGPPPDPRLTYAGPYQNIHPSVRFVGDATCAGCHPEHHEHYREHPMGRSMFAIADLAGRQRYDAKANNPFDTMGRRFRAVRDGDKVWHEQSAVYEGEELYRLRQPIQYALGSGTRGISYLTEQGGYLFQTPISWYSEVNKWDLSPGFTPPFLLGRPVLPGCLQCHVNRVKTLPDEALRYDKGVFEGHAIGCERCHGPGEKHVAWHLGDNEWVPRAFDPTIVNPAKLSPALRDNVCEQCHLQGEARVLRHGRDWFDYRPGLPLHDFLAVFVKDSEGPVAAKAVNHFEQMHVSTCYQKSAGKLGCISCHDPHRKPAAADRVTFFRERCLNCHTPPTGKPCKEDLAVRRRQAPGDSCIDCHMPRGGMTNIAHTSLTDHSVPRDRNTVPHLRRPPSARWTQSPIIHFHFDRVDRNDPESRRDLGMALTINVRHGAPWSPTAIPDAIALLEKAVRRSPADAAAWYCLGEMLLKLNRLDNAAAALEQAAALRPRDVQPLDLLGTVRKLQGKGDEAIALRRRLVELLPERASVRQELSQMLIEANQWDEARPHVREWLRLDPASTDARELWLIFLARDGNKAEARRQMAVLRKLLDPTSAQAHRVERWFARNVGP